MARNHQVTIYRCSDIEIFFVRAKTNWLWGGSKAAPGSANKTNKAKKPSKTKGGALIYNTDTSDTSDTNDDSGDEEVEKILEGKP